MSGAGTALMGIGSGVGENRAQSAARSAIASPLLETSIEGAKGMLFNIIGGSDLTMYEVNQAADIISRAADADANIIFGAVIDPALVDQVKITVIATGFDESRQKLRDLSNRPFHTQPIQVVGDDNQQSENPEANGERKVFGDSKDTGDTELDIPAFLRQGR
jgi:cell division protein FtsZ